MSAFGDQAAELASSAMSLITNFNFAWLFHLVVVDFVETLAVLSCVYAVMCLVFRMVIHEHITPDEYTQLFASLSMSVGILLSEIYENPAESNKYDNQMDYFKALVIVAMIRWTFTVQIRGKLYSFKDSVDLSDKVVIVTGATSGIGLEVARLFVENNPSTTVIIACRDVKKGEQVRAAILDGVAKNSLSKAHKAKVAIQQLDLESFQSCRDFAARINETYKTVDVLINNAGAMILQRSVTRENNIETMMQTNCFCSFLLTILLLPSLRASTLEGGARIVNVSSTTGKIHNKVLWDDMEGEQYYSMLYNYGHSKFCLNQMTIEFGKRLKRVKRSDGSGDDTSILVNTCHPGAVRTGVTRHLHWFLQLGANYIISAINKDAVMGAQTILYLASSKKLLANDNTGKFVTGKYFEHCEASEIPVAEDSEREKLFKYCEEKTGVQFDKYV